MRLFNGSHRPSSHRELADFLLLSLCIIFLFRAYVAEPYEVVTSSMAPTYWGRHTENTCSRCGETMRRPCQNECARSARDKDAKGTCGICSRCGSRLECFDTPVVAGDRVVAQKGAFNLSRYEVVVFKCPDKPRELFVKRIVGLPGEVVRIHEGDIQVLDQSSGKFVTQAKPLASIDEAAALVYEDAGVQSGSPRWFAHKPGDWKAAPGGYEVGTGSRAVLTYRDAAPFVGDALPGSGREPEDIEPVRDLIIDCRWTPSAAASRFEIVIGGDEEESRLVWESGNAAWKLVHERRMPGPFAAIEHEGENASLRQASHEAPAAPPHAAELTVSHEHAKGGTRTVRFAKVDRRLIAWIDDQLAGWTQLPEFSGHWNAPRTTIEINADGAGTKVTDLVLRRDIHYRQSSSGGSSSALRGDQSMAGRMAGATNTRTYRLKEDEYLLLGDNSAQSNDSRHWHRGHAVPDRLILGRVVARAWPLDKD